MYGWNMITGSSGFNIRIIKVLKKNSDYLKII